MGDGTRIGFLRWFILVPAVGSSGTGRAERTRPAPSREGSPERGGGARDEEAVEKTAAIEQRVAELESPLRSALGRNPAIRFDSLKVTEAVQPLSLGPLANPVPVPQWADFEPKPPSALGRMLGGGQRFQDARDAAEQAFATAQADYQKRGRKAARDSGGSGGLDQSGERGEKQDQ